jgi:hypothetical protein
VRNSFSGPDWGSNLTDNRIIDSEIDYWKTYGAGIYPSLVINNRTYRGQLESLAVFNAICAGFANPPAFCSSTLTSNQYSGNQISSHPVPVISALVDYKISPKVSQIVDAPLPASLNPLVA